MFTPLELKWLKIRSNNFECLIGFTHISSLPFLLFLTIAHLLNTASHIFQQQAQAQLIQTPDGQTFIYQPVQMDNTQTITQPQQTQPTRMLSIHLT